MAPRSFAALIDPEGVTLLEYRGEKGGFRLLDTRRRSDRFATPEDAADAVIAMLDDMGVTRATLSIVLQQFGAFFHTLPLPVAEPDHLRQVIEREVKRAFNVADPAIAYSVGPLDTARSGSAGLRHTFIAGAPRQVVDAMAARFLKRRIKVENLTVAPEVFRRLYDALDGSQEVTALLVCLPNGPHIAFFVNAALELAIEPPLKVAGEQSVDPAVIVDQLERGAIFLRQQAQGAVATRLLLSAPPEAYEELASAVEMRTGMNVAPLGKEIGSPESVVAMGAVLSSRHADGLDLYPRPPGFDEQLRAATSGPGLVTSVLMSAAAVAAFWAGMQVLAMKAEQRKLEEVQSRVERALPAIAGARQSARGRERIASIRTALSEAMVEKAAVAAMMNAVPSGPQPGTQLDSIQISRASEGMRTSLFGRASGPTGPAAMSAATFFYRRFKSGSGLKDVSFASDFLPQAGAEAGAPRSLEELTFRISALSPIGAK